MNMATTLNLRIPSSWVEAKQAGSVWGFGFREMTSKLVFEKISSTSLSRVVLPVVTEIMLKLSITNMPQFWKGMDLQQTKSGK